ncbi:MAG: C2H2-type zinc finger protein [Nitrososphaerales archaeon]
MITVECIDIKNLIVELAGYLSQKVAAVPVVKTGSIVLDPLTGKTLSARDVSVHVKDFLTREGLSNDFVIEVVGERIRLIGISEKKLRVETTDSDLLVCPHCGMVTRYEEELNVHIKIHYII